MSGEVAEELLESRVWYCVWYCFRALLYSPFFHWLAAEASVSWGVMKMKRMVSFFSASMMAVLRFLESLMGVSGL